MKLLCCIRCNQIFSLSHDYAECKGGHGGGQYTDNINAKVWGDPKQVFVLGFANGTFISALREQMEKGDSKEEFFYAGRMTAKGRDFTAFIIPESADSIIRVEDRFTPLQN